MEDVSVNEDDEYRDEPTLPTEDDIKTKNYNNLDLKNPYRENSSLDLGEMKKSFRWIETEVLMEMIKSGMLSGEGSVFFYILHFTRGYCNKNGYYRTIEYFPIDEIMENTGLSKTTVNRSLKTLQDRQMIYKVKERGIVKYGINFRYDTWVSNNLS